jgi:hypothetical protein
MTATAIGTSMTSTGCSAVADRLGGFSTRALAAVVFGGAIGGLTVVAARRNEDEELRELATARLRLLEERVGAIRRRPLPERDIERSVVEARLRLLEAALDVVEQEYPHRGETGSGE